MSSSSNADFLILLPFIFCLVSILGNAYVFIGVLNYKNKIKYNCPQSIQVYGYILFNLINRLSWINIIICILTLLELVSLDSSDKFHYISNTIILSIIAIGLQFFTILFYTWIVIISVYLIYLLFSTLPVRYQRARSRYYFYVSLLISFIATILPLFKFMTKNNSNGHYYKNYYNIYYLNGSNELEFDGSSIIKDIAPIGLMYSIFSFVSFCLSVFVVIISVIYMFCFEKEKKDIDYNYNSNSNSKTKIAIAIAIDNNPKQVLKLELALWLGLGTVILRIIPSIYDFKIMTFVLGHGFSTNNNGATLELNLSLWMVIGHHICLSCFGIINFTCWYVQYVFFIQYICLFICHVSILLCMLQYIVYFLVNCVCCCFFFCFFFVLFCILG